MIPYDHADVLERLWTQFQNAPNLIAALTKLLIDPANQAELLLEDGTKVNVVDGEGLALDAIGEMVNFPRGGLDDVLYRIALTIRTRTYVSGGTVPDFTMLLRAILPDHPVPIPVKEWFPASIRAYLTGVDPQLGKLIEALFRDNLKAAGVNGVFAVHEDTCVTFSSSHGPVTTLGWLGSSHGPTDTQAGWAHAIKI